MTTSSKSVTGESRTMTESESAGLAAPGMQQPQPMQQPIIPQPIMPHQPRAVQARVMPAGSDSGTCEVCVTFLCWLLVICTFPFSLCFCFKMVQQYERAIILRLGRKYPGPAKGPGLFFILPCIDEYCKVDLRTVTFDIPPQEILSKDSVTVSVDAVVYFKIDDPAASIINVWNGTHSTKLLAQTTLRNTLGMRTLAEMLSDRESIALIMQSGLDEATDEWGIKVERVEVKNVVLPKSLQRAMAAEAEATREAKAKVIAAEGEKKSAEALHRAAEVMASSPVALQLRYLQTLNTVSAEKSSKIIFPVPVDMLALVNK